MIIRGSHGLRWCDYQFSVPLLRESLQLPLLFQLMQSRDGKCHERWSFITQLGNQLRLRLSLDRMQRKMVDTNSVLCFSHSLPFIASRVMESAQAPPQPSRLFRCLTCINTKLCHFARIAGQSFFPASGLGQINRAVMLASFSRKYGMIFDTTLVCCQQAEVYFTSSQPASQLVSSYGYAMCRTATAPDLHISQRF